MKASPTTLESLADMHEVSSKGDLRRIIATALLALVRKEISATDVCALSSGVEAISNSMNVEMKLMRLRHDLRDSGGSIGGNVPMGRSAIGNS